jgi:hypothetical protein
MRGGSPARARTAGTVVPMMLRTVSLALLVAPLCVHCSSGPRTPDGGPASDARPDDASHSIDDVAAGEAAVDAAGGDAATAPPDADASSPLPPPVTKSDGTTPANFACNHHFTDPPAQPIAPHAFHVSVFYRPNTFDPLPGATVTLIDPATGLPGSNPSFTADASGSTSVPLAGNTRVAWWVQAQNGTSLRCDPCLDGYVFNYLAPSNDRASTDVVQTSGVEVDWFHGLTSGLGATPLVLGTVVDCDGDVVQNARVRVGEAPLCSAATGVFPCIAYRDEHSVDVSATATRATGVFVVVGDTPGPLSIRVEGRTDATQATTSVLGSLDVLTFERALSYGAATPLRE